MEIKLTVGLFMISLCMIISGCNRFSKEQAVQAFQIQYPTATIVRHFVGEGDSDHIYIHFQYLDDGSKDTMESVWLYQKQQDGEWKVINKNIKLSTSSGSV